MLIKVQVMDIILLLLSEQQQRCDYFFIQAIFSVDSGISILLIKQQRRWLSPFDTDTNMSTLPSEILSRFFGRIFLVCSGQNWAAECRSSGKMWLVV